MDGTCSNGALEIKQIIINIQIQLVHCDVMNKYDAWKQTSRIMH